MTREAWDRVNNHQPHEAKLSHEVIAATAAYEATKAWEEHQAKHGQPVNHARAKEFVAAGAAAIITHLAETKGLDALDAHKAREHHHHHPN